jgi:hypothetical protein
VKQASLIERLEQFAERARAHTLEAKELAREADELLAELQRHQESDTANTLRFRRKRFLDSAFSWLHELNEALTFVLMRKDQPAGDGPRREQSKSRG